MRGELPEALLPQEPGAQHSSLDDDDSVPELWGSRPDRLHEVRPQERVQRHAVEQIGDSAPFLPSLDVPVPLVGEQLVEVYKLLDVAVPEQVIEVPKIFVDDIPSRLSVRGRVGGCADAVPCSCSCAAFGGPAGGSAADRASGCPVFCGCGWVRLAADLWTCGGLLVEGGLLPPGCTARPGRDRNTGPPTLADVAVVDVPVNMQHKFQQSGMHSVVVQKTTEIPQLQFLDLVVVPVLCNDTFWYIQCRKLWNCRRCSSCGVVDVTVIIKLVPAVQSHVSRAIQSDRVPDIPVMLTVQFLNKVVDMVVYGSCPWFDSAEQLRSPTTSSTSQFQNSGSALDPVIDRAQ